jgi:hypothetical protein
MYCRAFWRYPRCTNTPESPIMPGSPSTTVIGGALIVALATWTIRRRHGGGRIEPAKPAN